jgi:hypothetical protein
VSTRSTFTIIDEEILDSHASTTAPILRPIRQAKESASIKAYCFIIFPDASIFIRLIFFLFSWKAYKALIDKSKSKNKADVNKRVY